MRWSATSPTETPGCSWKARLALLVGAVHEAVALQVLAYLEQRRVGVVRGRLPVDRVEELELVRRRLLLIQRGPLPAPHVAQPRLVLLRRLERVELVGLGLQQPGRRPQE